MEDRPFDWFADLLKSRNLIPLLLGVIFLFLYVIAEQYHWPALTEHLLRDVGISFVIAVVLATSIERAHRAHLEKKLDDRIERIAENVFSGTFRTRLPDAFVRSVLDLALKQKIVRRNFSAKYTLTNETCGAVGKAVSGIPYVRLQAVTAFVASNVSDEIFNYPLGVKLPNPINDCLKKRVCLLEFKVDDEKFDVTEANQRLQHELMSGKHMALASVGSIDLKPGQSVSIWASYKMVKEDEDTEFLRSLYPTESMEVTIVDNTGCNLIIDGQSIHAREKKNLTPIHDGMIYIWRIDEFLLPHQGMMFWWKQRSRTEKQGAFCAGCSELQKAPDTGDAT